MDGEKIILTGNMEPDHGRSESFVAQSVSAAARRGRCTYIIEIAIGATGRKVI